MKDKKTAALLAILVGGLGAHRFYLGQNLRGLANLFFILTLVPAIASLVNGIMMLSMDDEVFNMTYNKQAIETAEIKAALAELKKNS